MNKLDSNSIRKLIIETAYKSKASHIGSALSCVEIIQAIYENVDLGKIKLCSYDRDRIILSKAHGVCTQYCVMCLYGLMSEKDLSIYYQDGSTISGHSSHNVKYIECSAGALGHGISIALGISIGMKTRNLNGRVYCVVGDGEMNEGSNWEALMLAGNIKANNLCVIIDNNHLSGIDKTSASCGLEPLEEKLKAFLFSTHRVNGHNKEEIIAAMKSGEKPLAIICETIKGKGVSFMENDNIWHYRPLDETGYKSALKELDNL